ncbi:hypothetical protein EF405_11535 [Cyclobacteriaceae bacterium YHN15]|nr:hypothetical protein EF405_11535 [Cyclobacteriaceae bacterium YHN15]
MPKIKYCTKYQVASTKPCIQADIYYRFYFFLLPNNLALAFIFKVGNHAIARQKSLYSTLLQYSLQPIL